MPWSVHPQCVLLLGYICTQAICSTPKNSSKLLKLAKRSYRQLNRLREQFAHLVHRHKSLHLTALFKGQDCSLLHLNLPPTHVRLPWERSGSEGERLDLQMLTWKVLSYVSLHRCRVHGVVQTFYIQSSSACGCVSHTCTNTSFAFPTQVQLLSWRIMVNSCPWWCPRILQRRALGTT